MAHHPPPDTVENGADVDTFRTRSIERLKQAEQSGLRLAITLRTFAVGLAFIWYLAATLLFGALPRMPALGMLLLYTLIGMAHYAVIGTSRDRWWIKSLIVALDVVGICAAFVFIPISPVDDVPQILSMRIWGVTLLFPTLVLTGLSLSWRLVAWSGFLCSAGWWTIFVILSSKIAKPLSWDELTHDPTRADYENIFLSIDFIGRGTRVVETGVIICVAMVLAATVARARRVLLSQLKAEHLHASERRKHQNAADTLSRFVPETIAKRMLNSDETLQSEQRKTSVLMLDIADFTGFASRNRPREVIQQLDNYLSACAEIITENKGVVISYTGDGLLAAFNNPLPHHRPKHAALLAALAIHTRLQGKTFKCRIGLAHGDVVAGQIGSSSHMAFTVYGQPVNIAARLQAHAKELGQTMLVDVNIAKANRRRKGWNTLGRIALKGMDEKIEVFALSPSSGGNWK